MHLLCTWPAVWSAITDWTHYSNQGCEFICGELIQQSPFPSPRPGGTRHYALQHVTEAGFQNVKIFSRARDDHCRTLWLREKFLPSPTSCWILSHSVKRDTLRGSAVQMGRNHLSCSLSRSTTHTHAHPHTAPYNSRAQLTFSREADWDGTANSTVSVKTKHHLLNLGFK